MNIDPLKIFQVHDVIYHCHFQGFKDQQHGKIFKLNTTKRFKVFYENKEGQLLPVSDTDFKARNYEDLFSLIVSNVYPSIKQKLTG